MTKTRKPRTAKVAAGRCGWLPPTFGYPRLRIVTESGADKVYHVVPQGCATYVLVTEEADGTLGPSYAVDPVLDTCTCPDATYTPGKVCKHAKGLAVALTHYYR